MTNYGIVFGRKPAISFAEFRAVGRREGFRTAEIQPFLQGVFWSGTSDQESRALFDQLGGAIKLVEQISDFPIKGSIAENIRGALTPELLQSHQGDPTRPLKFGVSFYPLAATSEPYRLIKALTPHLVELRKAHPKSKWISSKDATLSSVIVTKEKLMERGVELNLFFDEKEIRIAKTLAVQDFKAFSERDYGRPGRDDQSGMLPPKLARILLNLSELPKDAVILDPHCGSGTVLQEALLLGFSNVMGSDLSTKAIADTRRNLEWLRRHHRVPPPLQLLQCDATKLEQYFSKKIHGIVTEPFLGPSRPSERRSPERVVAMLAKLYLQTFASYARVLRPSGIVVSIFPVFVTGKQRLELPILADLHRRGFQLLSPELAPGFEKTARGTLLYGRPQQAVEREITLWRYTEK